MLFRTRFSTTFSAMFSTIFENIKKNIVLVTSLSETSTFYHILIFFTAEEVFNISSKYWSLKKLPTHWYFYIRNFITLLYLEKTIDVLHRKCFSNRLLFITFSLLVTVSEVYNISNKYWHTNKSVKNCFYTRHRKTFRLLRNKRMRFPSQKLIETFTFYHIFASFIGGWGVQCFK